MSIRIARAYEEPRPDDVYRVLVDRVWPRGRSRERLRIDEWLREVAPSDELRRWFGHDPARWEAFRRRYRQELSAPERQPILAGLVEKARHGPITLVYGARDPEHNQAAVLAEVIAERLIE